MRKPGAPHAGPPRSPWPPRHAAGRSASRGGTRARHRAAPAFSSLGELSCPKKRLNPFKEKPRTKYSSNQILLLPPGLGLHSGLDLGVLPSAGEKLSYSCSRESSDLPAPARPSRVGTCSGAPASGKHAAPASFSGRNLCRLRRVAFNARSVGGGSARAGRGEAERAAPLWCRLLDRRPN